jgi:hypothetical protein
MDWWQFEKMWNSPCIAIEDPFELNHNLGAGISRKSKLRLSYTVHDDKSQCTTGIGTCFQPGNSGILMWSRWSGTYTVYSIVILEGSTVLLIEVIS